MFFSICRNWFFLFIPLLSAILGLRLKLSVGPYWLGFNSDPAYHYLINSLYPLKGVAPYFTDHPGTTVQILLNTLYRILNLGKSPDQIIEAVLRNPEFYLNIFHIFLAILFFVSLAWLGKVAFRLSGSRIFALLIQTPVFFYLTLPCGPVIPVLTHINAEPLLATLINLLAIVLLSFYWKDNQKRSLKEVALFSLICGAGLATKFTFLPLMLLPIVIIPKIKQRFIFLAGTLVVFFGLTLPIWGRFTQVTEWLSHILLNPTSEGGGFKDLRAWLISYGEGFMSMWRAYLLPFFLTLFLMGIGYLRQKKGHRYPFDKIILAGTVIIFFLFIVITRRPGMQYLIIVWGALGIISAFSYLGAREARFRYVKVMGVISLVLIVLIGSLQSMVYASKLEHKKQEIFAFDRSLREKFPDCKRIGYYRSSSPQMALRLGDMVGDVRILGQELNRLYPNSFFFHMYTYRVGDFARDLRIFQILEKFSCVIFQGTCGYDFSQGPYETELVEQCSSECAYRLVKSTEEEGVKWFLLADVLEKKGSYFEAYLAIKQSLDNKFARQYVRSVLDRVCPEIEGNDIFHLCHDRNK